MVPGAPAVALTRLDEIPEPAGRLPCVASVSRVATGEQFWARRLRWRLIGAWRWPLFLVTTVLDAVIVNKLPPTGGKALFFPALFVCSFVNLFLIGAVAPWLARRIAARQGATASGPPTFPPSDHAEVLVDRVAAIVLVLATVGLFAAGLGNRRVVVADTDRLARAGAAVRAYVGAHAPDEIRQRVDAANTHPTQEDGFFRTCIPYDDARRQYCMFVDANKRPPRVTPDRDTRPNEVYFRTP
jgi:hypothetical protein